jgi:hypothetical protein
VAEDPTIQLGIYGVITAIVSTLGVVVVALINNRKERSDSAEAGIVVTLRERITLRDEQIEDLEQQIAELNEKVAELTRRLEEKHDQA